MTDSVFRRKSDELDAAKLKPLLLRLDSRYEITWRSPSVILDVILPQYKNNLGRWAVHLKSNHEFIGWCGLKYILEVDEIDLGYRFFESHWGKAYATESALACFNYGIQKLGLKTIVGRAAIENIASRKVLEKTGMSYIGDDIEHGNKIAKYRFSV